MPRPLRFNAFVSHTNSHIHHGQWRRPDAGQVDFDRHPAAPYRGVFSGAEVV